MNCQLMNWNDDCQLMIQVKCNKSILQIIFYVNDQWSEQWQKQKQMFNILLCGSCFEMKFNKKNIND